MPVWFTGLWAKLAAVGLVIVTVLAFIGKVFAVGKQVERGKQADETLKVKDAQQDAAANAPRDQSGVVDRLRRGGF
jgi:hypothetical protein